MVKLLGSMESPPEVYKHGGLPLWRILYEIVLDFWKKEVPPKDWIDAMIIKLFKKGDTTDCGNYRGISLLSMQERYSPTFCCVDSMKSLPKWFRKRSADSASAGELST